MGQLDLYTIKENRNLFDAIKAIDKNRKGFVIVVGEKNDKVVGVMTDGDIRRAFIAGKRIEDLICGVCRKEFSFLRSSDSLAAATELFKNNSINFLPILDHEGRLTNLLTKRQMHALLLQDIQADLAYDFLTLDESIIDYEIYQKPWGFYKTTVLNRYFQSKVMHIKPGAALSLQSHAHREEYWIVTHGSGWIQIDLSEKNVKCGDMLFIPCGAKHRIKNTDEKETLIITEVQLGTYLGEDDIVRYEDIYGRTEI